jgi:hypothetical protein
MKRVIAKNLPDLNVIDGVRVVNICDWLTAAYGEDYWGSNIDQPDYEQTGKELMSWCAENNSAYWAAPRGGVENDDFFIQKAVSFAKARGHSMVVVEDLS